MSDEHEPWCLVNTNPGARPADPRLDPPPSWPARALARLAALLLPLRGGVPSRAGLRRVLIVRTDDRVGNALLTLPLARALADALPGAQIDLLLPASRLQTARGLPGFGLVEFRKQDSFRHPLRFLRFLAAVRARGYDAAIDAAHWHAFSLTSALLARWASRRWVVGSARGATCLYSSAVELPAPGTPEVAAKVALAGGLGLPSLPVPPLETSLGASPAEQAAAKREREALGLAGPFAALNPGARKADHRWDPQQFAALARALRREHALPSLVLWGPGEEPLARAVCAASEGAALLAPPTDLSQLAAHLRASALAVTNDTGPMHLAVACGAPVLAIFLAADGARWGHPGPRFAGVDAPASAPGAPARDPSLDLRAAEAAAARLLALTSAGPRRELARPMTPSGDAL